MLQNRENAYQITVLELIDNLKSKPQKSRMTWDLFQTSNTTLDMRPSHLYNMLSRLLSSVDKQQQTINHTNSITQLFNSKYLYS